MLWILRLIFSPITLLRFILIVLNAIVSLGILRIEDVVSKRRGKFTFFAARFWGRSTLFLMGVFVKHNQRPSLQCYLIMPNHRSYVDILIMAAYSPSAFVSKAEVSKWPILGQALKFGRAILVQRDEMKSLLATMKKIQASIDQDIPITIFPEGTTYKGPGLKPFKNGTFKIAADNNIPVIPCAIEYHDPKLHWISAETFILHFFKHFWKPYSIANLQFGPPIHSRDFKTLKEATRNAILEMLDSHSSK